VYNLALQVLKIPNSMLRDPQKPVLEKIAFHFNPGARLGTCDAGLDLLCQETGKSKHTVIDAIRSLEEEGWLTVERSKGGGRNHPNHYVPDADKISAAAGQERVQLLHPLTTKVTPPAEEKGCNPTPERVQSDPGKGAVAAPDKEDIKREIEKYKEAPPQKNAPVPPQPPTPSSIAEKEKPMTDDKALQVVREYFSEETPMDIWMELTPRVLEARRQLGPEWLDRRDGREPKTRKPKVWQVPVPEEQLISFEQLENTGSV
jgi:hypothetical protein